MRSVSFAVKQTAGVSVNRVFMPDDLGKMKRVFSRICEKLSVPAENGEMREKIAIKVMEHYEPQSNEAVLFYEVLVRSSRAAHHAKEDDGRYVIRLSQLRH